MLGIINLYKPKGKTSHDMVYFIRRTLGIKRVGHTGTLDPCAEGVLPILIGRATSLSDYLMAGDKTYIASVRLGIETDTYDLTGKVTATSDKKVTYSDICRAKDAFTGEIMQLPPMYSAIKVGGRKLYDMARRGLTAKITPRKIIIESINILDFDEKENIFKMEVNCSKGTYIRSLCHDMGKLLGCGAAMAELVRTKTGRFSIEDSHTEEEILKAAESGNISALMTDVESVLDEFPKIYVDSSSKTKICNGIRLRTEQINAQKYKPGDKFTVFGDDGIICLAEVINSDGDDLVKIDKGFY